MGVRSMSYLACRDESRRGEGPAPLTASSPPAYKPITKAWREPPVYRIFRNTRDGIPCVSCGRSLEPGTALHRGHKPLCLVCGFDECPKACANLVVIRATSALRAALTLKPVDEIGQRLLDTIHELGDRLTSYVRMGWSELYGDPYSRLYHGLDLAQAERFVRDVAEANDIDPESAAAPLSDQDWIEDVLERAQPETRSCAKGIIVLEALEQAGLQAAIPKSKRDALRRHRGTEESLFAFVNPA